jgi:hypothetical protein
MEPHCVPVSGTCRVADADAIDRSIALPVIRLPWVGDLAQLLVLPRAALSGEDDVVVVGAGPTVSADQVPVRRA